MTGCRATKADGKKVFCVCTCQFCRAGNCLLKVELQQDFDVSKEKGVGCEWLKSF
jgi:hypothetical protein